MSTGTDESAAESQDADGRARGVDEHRVGIEVRIRPRKGWRLPDFRELWAYRELMYVLCWRDIKVRYTQTVLGIAWAVIQPLMIMLVFSIFFGNLANVPSDHIPYPLFSLTALVPWAFFSAALTQSSTSVVDGGQLVSKVYFPRLLLPIASTLSSGVDFAISFLVLLGVMGYYGVMPRGAVVILPLLVLIMLCAAIGLGLWFSALNVQFRDVRHALPFVTQLLLFLTPIAYPASLVSQPWRTAYAINPMVGVVEGFRWALLRAPTDPTGQIIVSSVVAVALLVTGTLYFNRVETRFADLI